MAGEAIPNGRQNQVSKKVMETALAWMRGEIRTGEASTLIRTKSTNQTIYRLGIAIRQAHREGLLRERDRV